MSISTFHYYSLHNQAGSLALDDSPAPQQPKLQRKEKTLFLNGSCCLSLPPPLASAHGRYDLFVDCYCLFKYTQCGYVFLVVVGWSLVPSLPSSVGEKASVEIEVD